MALSNWKTLLQDQSHCTDTGYYTIEKRDKPLLLKKLKKLWDKREPGLPWEKGVYNESNTLLVDDTPSKALSNPVSFIYSLYLSNKRTFDAILCLFLVTVYLWK